MHKLKLGYKVEIPQTRPWTRYCDSYTDKYLSMLIFGAIRPKGVAANFYLATNGNARGSAQYDFKLAVIKAKIYNLKIEENFILKPALHSKILAFCWRNRAYRPAATIYKKVERW